MRVGANSTRRQCDRQCECVCVHVCVCVCVYVCVCVCACVCEVCSRTFRRESDKKRHKCLAERQKPVSEQRGSVQCLQCKKWFRSRGGLAVHTCRPGG